MPTTVLIADESVTIRSVAESLLRGESYSVHSAADGNLALELAQAERPSLVLIGEKLAGRSGEDVCNEIKAHPDLKDTPIIFLRTDHPGAPPPNVDLVLTKPFSPQSLLDAVHRFVAAEASPKVEMPLSATPDPGLEDELIDQALGLDDVGPAPAEEREVSAKAVRPTDEDGAEEEMSAALGLVDDLDSLGEERALESDEEDEDPELGQASVDADSLEFTQLPQVADAVDDELDRALDMALGDADSPLDALRPESKPEDSAPAESRDPSSLNEISLGESEHMPLEPADGPDASPATPGDGIDLGGPDEPIEQVGDRPHDYDWFIKEMQQETDDKITPAPPPEPPSIEPVEPRAPVEAEPPRARTDSQLQIDGSEEMDESRRGYDEFITEFRAEIAKLEGMAAPQSQPPDPESSPDQTDTRNSQAGEIAFDDSRVDIVQPPQETASEPGPEEVPVSPATTQAQLREMSNTLIESVTQMVARELAAKIDSKAIYALIEQKLKEANQQKNQS